MTESDPEPVINCTEIPHRSTTPYRGVLSFLSKAREASGSETPRVIPSHFQARQMGTSCTESVTRLVGCSTGRSLGFAPRRILSTYSAARRNRSGKFGP
jgi:hypothetical protein